MQQESITDDYDMRYNYFALKAWMQSKEIMTVSQALSEFGLISLATEKSLEDNKRWKTIKVKKEIDEVIINPKNSDVKPHDNVEFIDQVNRIYDNGYSIRELAKIYGYSLSFMGNLIRNPRPKGMVLTEYVEVKPKKRGRKSKNEKL